jgi:putative SOS response-associated peptidase YedK
VVITTDANELVAQIHNRMPMILAPRDYARWLSDEPDVRYMMGPFPAEPMRMWPISTRVNRPDDASTAEKSRQAFCRQVFRSPGQQCMSAGIGMRRGCRQRL